MTYTQTQGWNWSVMLVMKLNLKFTCSMKIYSKVIDACLRKVV